MHPIDSVSVQGTLVNFLREGEVFFSVPACACINGEVSRLALQKQDETELLFGSPKEEMRFSLGKDHVIVEYCKRFDSLAYVDEVKLFTGGGMRVSGFDRAFCPQPHGNGQDNMTYFDRLPDISAYGYNSPSVLEFALGSPKGWVSVGLLDLPDTKECRMLCDFSFLVERCGANKATKEYRMPRILITFPKDEFDSIALFRKKAYGAWLLHAGKQPRFAAPRLVEKHLLLHLRRPNTGASRGTKNR